MEWLMLAMAAGLSGLAGLVAGAALARWVSLRLAWGLCALSLIGAVALVVLGQGQPGMDGLGQVILAVLFLAPAGLGAALGAVIAAARGRTRP